MIRLGRIAFVVALVVAFGGCATDEVRTGSRDQQVANISPWKQPSKWPYRIESPRLVVHYQLTTDLAMAKTVFADVEDAWRIQIIEQGSRPPLDDGGVAGPDGRFDVYLYRGLDSLYVSSLAANTATPYDDWSTVMVVDPWGQYGGPDLRANVFHELRHASQGADDWWEHAQFFEAEATLWETAYYGYDRLSVVWADYQAHPEWTPFRNDRYSTWFMYGGALFLLYLRQNVFAGSLAFANDVWFRSRNPAGTNEPDFADALQTILATRGTSLFAQITAFACARWYTGARANGTLDGGPSIAEVASTTHTRSSGAQKTSFVINPQMLGTIYTVVQSAPTDGTTLRISLSNIDTKAKPVVQVVGQTSGDRVLDLSSGGVTVALSGGKVVIAVTVLPSSGTFDPDSVGTQLLKATVNVDRI